MQGVQFAAHPAAERIVHQFVLLHARYSGERSAHHMRGVVVAVARKIADLDLGIGDCGAAQTWAWTGQGFTLTQESIMGECAGVPSDLWPVSWRTR